MKKDILGCLFSVIFVPCGTSDIYFVSDIALQAVVFACGELRNKYNITETEGFNNTFMVVKISLQRSWNSTKNNVI